MSGLRPSNEALAVLIPALEEAVARAVAESGITNPFVVEIRLRDYEFPPFIRVGSERFRERMTSLSAEREGAVESLYRATPPDGVTLQLADHLDADALEVCRELNSAASEDRRRASEISQEIGRELARRLNDRDWPGASEPFLALVRIGQIYEDTDPYDLAVAAVGGARVQAFRDSLASRAQASAPADFGAIDRDGLARVLQQRGISAPAQIAAAAERSFHLEATDDDARSRLGGRGLLPPGEVWPHARGERPLSFLGAIDLSEFPSDTPLPNSGWMLFYADLDNDEALGLIEPEENVPGAPGRFYFAAEAVAAQAPPGTIELNERHVRPVEQLTLPDDYEVAERLRLDPAEASVYEEIANGLRYGDEGWGGAHDHWVLGAATGAQGHPSDEGTVLLFHIAWDTELGFEFLDGGVIQFRIAAEALASRDWSAVTIEPDSG
jgi:uncharacterized protein DUF1963